MYVAPVEVSIVGVLQTAVSFESWAQCPKDSTSALNFRRPFTHVLPLRPALGTTRQRRRPLPIAFECLHHTPQTALALLPASVSFDPLKWHSADFSFRHREAADVVPLANDSIAGGKRGCLGWL